MLFMIFGLAAHHVPVFNERPDWFVVNPHRVLDDTSVWLIRRFALKAVLCFEMLHLVGANLGTKT